ncbi:mitochondrial potassium channel ATP-binding subunit-like [Chrysoperla carnea]|uniref:mitochondrial potassium channel ATP-binding subunit-like n=1 Tax=Chrysoperla carnea TaxID=189513 RepID=UPI001D06BFC6|nr:mitochondrial potassium channel ATP-binding subunit-like [Chrysoperla carnea]
MWKLILHHQNFTHRTLLSNHVSNKPVFWKQYLINKQIPIKLQHTVPKDPNKVNSIFKLSALCKISLGVTGSIIHATGIKFAYCKPKATRIIDYKPDNNKVSKFDWNKLWSYLKPELLWFIAAVASALVVAIVNIQIPQVMAEVINVIVKSTGDKTESSSFLNNIKPAAINLVFMYLAQSAFTFVYIVLLSKIGESMAFRMKSDLFKSILKQDIAFFDTHRTGEVVNRLTVDVQEFKSSFKQTISNGLRAMTQIIGSGVALFTISPYMTSLTLFTIPTIILLGSGFGALLRKKSREAQAQSEKTTSIAEEAISNIRTVRGFAMEDLEVQMFDSELSLVQHLNINLGVGIGLFQAGTNLFLNGMILSTISVGGYLLSTNQLSAGQLMAFLMATQTIQRSLTQISLLFGSVIRGLAAGSRVFEYINLQPTMALKGGLILSDNVKGFIEFKNVTFTYPARPDNIVLDSFNLTVEPGKTVALVGASGNGKSTVVALLERFYDADRGSISIDGYNIRSLDPTWLRQKVIGIVNQEPILFGCTIRENIRYGKMDASDEEIEAAAKLANAHDFIEGFSNGYDTMVGERGSTLSGGQKQRIAIARALLKNPSILILDEATSALDSESEKLVQKALENASIGRTCFVIAHRLSTIQNADVIIVLQKGQVVEMGTHNELLGKRGIYWSLVLQQQLSQEKHIHHGE